MAYWLAVVLGIGAAVAAQAETRTRPYKYYLDASRAEEVLAAISIRPRLVDDEWLNIVGPRRDDTYKVRRGDTLWRISARELGDPKLWRKLWQVNSFLTNPHELEVGQILKYYMEGSSGGGTATAEGGLQIPLIKLLPGGVGKGLDLDADNAFNRDLKNAYRPALLIAADRDVLGEVTGAYTEKEALGELDEIYLNFWLAESVKIGDLYAVARYERLLTDTTQSSRPVIGTLMRQVGVVRVRGFGEKLVRGELVSVRGLIRRRDALVALPAPVQFSAFFNPPPEFSAKIVTGEDEDRSVYGQGDIVLINKGSLDGMKAGYLFRIFHDRDLKSGRADHVEASFKGEVQIVSTGQYASVGYVLRNTEPVLPGDIVIPTQAFLNPPPPPARPVTTIELQ